MLAAKERMLTPKEFARIFRVRNTKIYGWIARGWITAINVSTTDVPAFRIDPSEVEQLKKRLEFQRTPKKRRRKSTVSPGDAKMKAQISAALNS